MTIYDRIRALRIELGMSQDDLARKVGYTSRGMISKVEKGQVDLTGHKIMDFADALNTTPRYLMGWDDGNDEGPLPPDEVRLLDYYRMLSPRGKQVCIERAQELTVLYGKKSDDVSNLPECSIK